MHAIFDRLKRLVPPATRAVARHLAGRLPFASRFAGLPLCPWRVGFVVGGTQKGGTTALSAFLDSHPELCMAAGKEAHFFDDDAQFAAGPADPADYHKRFAPGPETRLLGDATPIYLYWLEAARRAMAYNPRMKWVLLLRQPADRAYSAWEMERRRGAESLSFADAIAAEPARLRAAGGQCRVASYLDRGYYARQLRRLFAVVPRRQVLVLRSEELRDDHDTTLRRVFGFLGVDASVRVPPARHHESAYAEPLPPDLRRALTARFADDLADLERLMGWDVSAWRA